MPQTASVSAMFQCVAHSGEPYAATAAVVSHRVCTTMHPNLGSCSQGCASITSFSFYEISMLQDRESTVKSSTATCQFQGGLGWFGAPESHQHVPREHIATTVVI